MEFKELATTGVQLPEIGLGTWRYYDGVEALRKGISLGAVLIDTAEMYNTEDLVGEAIKGQREQIFVATKVLGSHLQYREVLKAADNSLKKLAIDHIDLYQIHWPSSAVPIEETMEAMETLVDQGKVKFIGVSNFSVKELQAAQQSMCKYSIVSNQVLYGLRNREIEADMLPYCQSHDITVIAYSPLAQGALVNPRLTKGHNIQVLQTVAHESGKTVAQVALNWCTAKPQVIAIPKAGKVEHVEEDCGASGWRLSARHLEELDRAF